MISSKADYRFYLEADRIALCMTRRRPRFVDDTWRFQRLLRKVEYYLNCKPSPVHRAYLRFLYLRYHLMAQKLGFTIWPNTCGPGLCLPHRGSILISARAQIGENCRIHAHTSIGTEVRFGDRAPRIGNNVYIGPGAKVFGDIVIGDDVAIAANAVVNRSFEAPHQTIGGIPARRIGPKGTDGLLLRATELARARQTERRAAIPRPTKGSPARWGGPVARFLSLALPRLPGRNGRNRPRSRS
jgi:serine O-acetyltransferase